jgi:hypothetical protein
VELAITSRIARTYWRCMGGDKAKAGTRWHADEKLLTLCNDALPCPAL